MRTAFSLSPTRMVRRSALIKSPSSTRKSPGLPVLVHAGRALQRSILPSCGANRNQLEPIPSVTFLGQFFSGAGFHRPFSSPAKVFCANCFAILVHAITSRRSKTACAMCRYQPVFQFTPPGQATRDTRHFDACECSMLPDSALWHHLPP